MMTTEKANLVPLPPAAELPHRTAGAAILLGAATLFLVIALGATGIVWAFRFGAATDRSDCRQRHQATLWGGLAEIVNAPQGPAGQAARDEGEAMQDCGAQ